MITVGKCEKVSWVHIGKTEDNFIEHMVKQHYRVDRSDFGKNADSNGKRNFFGEHCWSD